MLGEELVSSSMVVNALWKDFNILTGVKNAIQNLPTTKNQIRSCLVVEIAKYKNMPWLVAIEWDKLVKFKNHFKCNAKIQ